MRVLHIETGRHLYGGAQQVLELLRGLHQAGHGQHELACPADAALAKAARPFAQVSLLRLHGDADPRLLSDLRRILRARPPDLVHIHSRRGADFWGLIAARMVGAPVVLTRRVDNPEPGWWARWKYSQCAAVIAISRGIREVLLGEGVSEEQIAVVPSAVDPERYSKPCNRAWLEEKLGPLGEGPLIGIIAQLIKRKGHQDLLTALPQIGTQALGVHVLFLGQGPMESQLQEQAKHLGITDRVHFCGFRDYLDRILPCLDMVVHPAHMEGLGVALLEAAAAGVPIVATQVGGIPEIVHDRVNGLLVPPHAPARIAEAVTALHRDPQWRQRMGEKGQHLVREAFSPNVMVRGNLAIYQRLVPSEGPFVA